MLFKKIELAPNIIHLKFKRKRDLTRHFLRFQEHFESPKFRGKVFSLSEFKPWYKKEKGKTSFTYYEDWSGFNFPSKTLKPFLEGKFNPLSGYEKKIIKTLEGYSGKFYVIGTFKDADLKHELAHALFYVDDQYHAKVMKILASIDKKVFIDRFIEMRGYHPSVWDDEVHAYLLETASYIREEFPKVQMNKFADARHKLNDTFKQHKPK